MSHRASTSLVIYSPDSKVRHPLGLFKEMWRDLKGCRHLAWRLTVRDISAKYRQSFFGIFWVFVPPIGMGAVFIFLNSRNLINIGETDIPYPAFAMFGTVLWQVFVDSLNAPLKAFSLAKPMLAKIDFAREAVVLSALEQVLFDLAIRLSILAAVFLIFQVPLSWGILGFPLAAGVLVLLGITIGLLLVPIGLLYSDISQGLIVVIGLWFFITPVIYPVPKSWPYSLLGMLNPVSPPLVAARDFTLSGGIENVWPFVIVSLLTLLSLFFAWVLMRLAMPIVIERMGA